MATATFLYISRSKTVLDFDEKLSELDSLINTVDESTYSNDLLDNIEEEKTIDQEIEEMDSLLGDFENEYGEELLDNLE